MCAVIIAKELATEAAFAPILAQEKWIDVNISC
jgi:hypothetical protein